MTEGLAAEWVGNTDKGGPQPPYCKGHKDDREMVHYGVEHAVGNVYSEFPEQMRTLAQQGDITKDGRALHDGLAKAESSALIQMRTEDRVRPLPV